MNGFIYKITNTLNGSVYVGQTICKVTKRWNQHKALSTIRSSSMHITRAIHKYGPAAFEVETLAEVPCEWLDVVEVAFISACNSHDARFGYNLTAGGSGYSPSKSSNISKATKGRPGPNKGKHLSDETKRRLSVALTGKPAYNKGISPSDETRAKQSAARMGRVNSAETIAKQVASRAGYSHTAETRALIAAANTGRPVSDETRALISAANTGKPGLIGRLFSEETKALMSTSRKNSPLAMAQLKIVNDRKIGKPAHNKGSKHTPETKAKMSAYWAAKRDLRKAA